MIRIVSLALVFLVTSCFAYTKDLHPGEAFWLRGSYTSESGEVVAVSLVGTIHVSSQESLAPYPALEKDLVSKDVLYMEVDPRELADVAGQQVLIARYGSLPQGSSLRQILGRDYQVVNEGFQKFGYSASLFDRFHPWMVTVSFLGLAMNTIGMTGQGKEEGLIAWADGAGRQWLGLETLESQFQALTLGTMEEHARELVETSTTSLEEIKSDLFRLEDAWIRGDPQALKALVLDEMKASYSKERYEALMDDRNRAWTETILTRLQGGDSVLVAVGTGHLLGENSLPELLAKGGVVWHSPLP